MGLHMAKKKEKKASAKIIEKAWVKAFLMILSVALMFMGPTYFMYILNRFHIPYLILVLLGLASFAFGAILFASVFSKEKGKGSL
jgi:cytochrome c biogenesis protein CcdA